MALSILFINIIYLTKENTKLLEEVTHLSEMKMQDLIMAEHYLNIALERSNQIDKLPHYSSYLKDEWISTKEDLWLTLDESTWQVLKLPFF